MLYRVLVPIHSSNVGREIVPASVETLAQSPACRMVTRETPAAKAAEAATPRESLETYVLEQHKELSLPKKKWCWTPASSLTTFKLALKNATLLALGTAKHCSDLSLLCIDNQHLFLQHDAAIFIPMSGGKTDCLGHLPPQVHIESRSNVHLCPVFYLKAYLRCTESFQMKPDGSCVTSLFLCNNRRLWEGHKKEQNGKYMPFVRAC